MEINAKQRFMGLLSNDLESTLRERGWTPAQAARATGLPERDIAAMKNGNLFRFEPWDLLDALTRIGCSMTLVIHPPDDEVGLIHVQGVDDE